MIHSENFLSNSFQIKRNTIVVTALLLIMNQTEVCSVHNRKVSYHYGRIPFNLKGIRKKFSECMDKCGRATFIVPRVNP